MYIYNQCIRGKTGAQNIAKEIKQYHKSGYNTYRGWTQTEYQNKLYNINQKDKETLDDRGRDGGINFILRIREQETHVILHEHDDDDDDDDDGKYQNDKSDKPLLWPATVVTGQSNRTHSVETKHFLVSSCIITDEQEAG
jgi:hypothetical protein